MEWLSRRAVVLFALGVLFWGLYQLPRVLLDLEEEDAMKTALVGVALVLTLMVCLLIHPPPPRPAHPGFILCLLGLTVCLLLLGWAAFRV